MPPILETIAEMLAAGLLGALFGSLAARQIARNHFRQLRERIETAEGRDIARQLRFEELAEQVERHLKRVQAIRQHRENGSADPRDALISRLKFPSAGE